MSGPMGLIYPTQGDTSDVWGTVLNTLLGLVENHDHTSGKGMSITTEALSIDADLSWASHAITAMSALAFTEVAESAVIGYNDALFVNWSDHNLYFRNQGGTDVQITDGNTLNISIVGGIGGDYSTVGALFSYDDSTKRYLAQQEGSPRPWAGFATGDLDLYQKAASIANKVTLKSPSSLAASYTMTFPTAVPAATSIMQMSAAGVVTASNVLATNQNLGLTGTGYVQRATGPTRVFPLIVAASVTLSGSDAVQSTSVLGGIDMSSSSEVAFPLLGLTAEEVLTVISVCSTSLSGGTATYVVKQQGINGNSGDTTSALTIDSGGTATSNTGFGVSGPPSLPFGYWMIVTTGSGATLAGLQAQGLSVIP